MGELKFRLLKSEDDILPSYVGNLHWQDLTDEELFVLTREGERDAFRLIVERHQGTAFHVAQKYVRSAEVAREIVQEAFLWVYRSRERFDANKSFLAWFYRILRNNAVDTQRRLASGTPGAAGELVGDFESFENSPEAEASRLERLEFVRATLDSLPVRSSEVLRLREFDRLSCKEIGQSLGISSGTVRWRLHHARKLFRQHWERIYGRETLGKNLL